MLILNVLQASVVRRVVKENEFTWQNSHENRSERKHLEAITCSNFSVLTLICLHILVVLVVLVVSGLCGRGLPYHVAAYMSEDNGYAFQLRRYSWICVIRNYTHAQEAPGRYRYIEIPNDVSENLHKITYRKRVSPQFNQFLGAMHACGCACQLHRLSGFNEARWLYICIIFGYTERIYFDKWLILFICQSLNCTSFWRFNCDLCDKQCMVTGDGRNSKQLSHLVEVVYAI